MPMKTSNYGLVKPLDTEYYDINIQNGNMDIIDREMSKISSDSNKRIDEVEAKINDGQLKTFETDVLLTKLEGCNGGFVNVDKIEGRTLVNAFIPYNKEIPFKFGNDKAGCYSEGLHLMKPNTTYSQIILGWQPYLNQYVGYNGSTQIVGYTNSKVVVFTTPSTIPLNTFVPHINSNDNRDISSLKLAVLLLEGDWSNKQLPPSVFYGTKSVGEYNYVNGKYVGKNLIDCMSYTTGNGISLNDKLQEGKTYTLSHPIKTHLKIAVESGANTDDASKTLSSNTSDKLTFTFNKSQDWKLYVWKDWLNGNVEYYKEDAKIQLEEGNIATTYEPYYEGVKLEISSESENLLDIYSEPAQSPFGNIPDAYKCIAQDGKLYVYAGANNYHGYGFKRWLNKGEYYLSSKNLTPKKSGYVILNSDTEANIQIKNVEQDILNVPTDGWYYVCFDIVGQSSLTDPLILTDIMLTKGTDRKDYKPYDSNKTEILLKEPLREWDILKSNGEIDRNSKELLIDENLNWWIDNTGVGGLNAPTTKFYMSLDCILNVNDVKCDKFPTLYTYNNNNEGIFLGTAETQGYLWISVLNSRIGINTSDDISTRINKFKVYLSTNRFPITYRALKATTENANKTLISKGYLNGYLQINFGAIQPHAVGSYSTNTGERMGSMENAIEGVKNQADILEDAVTAIAGNVINNKRDIAALQDKNTQQDNAINQSIATSKGYTDGQVSTLNNAIIQGKTDSINYTNQKISELSNRISVLKIPIGRPATVEDGMIWLE